MNKFERIFIFFDTNVLESRHSGNLMFLSQIKIPPKYFELLQTIRESSLHDKVRLCIPDIALKELKKHMIDSFKSEQQSLIDTITIAKKTFGDLLVLEYEFKCKDHIEYERIAEERLRSFFADTQRSTDILETPITEDIIKKIIDKAINTEKPFMKPKVSNSQKECTDAGFKDALIYETFITNIDNDALCLFVSNDSDFAPLFHDISPNIKLCKSIDEAIYYIKQNFNIAIEQDIATRIKTEDYLQETIVNEVGLDVSARRSIYTDIIVTKERETTNESNDPFTYSAKFGLYIGEERFKFSVTYDPNANEITNVDFEPEEIEHAS